VEEWRECNERKSQLDRKLSSSAFREAMIAKITTHKNKLVAEIKQKFKELQENIKLAEKRAFDDVAKRFKVVAQKITLLDRQDQQTHQLYQKWHSACQPLFQTTTFDAKATSLASSL
jgi:prephenate dehydrogenase